MSETSQAPAGTRNLTEQAPSLDSYRCEIVERPDMAWDELAAGFTDMCLEQTVAFTASRFGAAQSLGVILRDAGNVEPLAMALAVVATLPVIGLGLAYVKFGPLWRRRGMPVRPELLVLMLEALKRELGQKRGLALRIMPPVDPDHEKEWDDALTQTKFIFQAGVPDPARYLVDLKLSEAEQLKSLGPKWRSNLAKSAIDDLDIREVNLEQGLGEFLELYHEMLSRKRFNDRHGVEDLLAIARAAGPVLGLRLFLAFHAGKPVVGSVIVGTGERVFVPFSATDEKALELRAGYALRWRIMESLRGGDARWLDLGGDEGDQGLRHYKLGNVGKRGRIAELSGEFDFAPNALAAAAAKVIMLGREWARSNHLKKLMLLLPI